jgi:hypothetical protein
MQNPGQHYCDTFHKTSKVAAKTPLRHLSREIRVHSSRAIWLELLVFGLKYLTYTAFAELVAWCLAES